MTKKNKNMKNNNKSTIIISVAIAVLLICIAVMFVLKYTKSKDDSASFDGNNPVVTIEMENGKTIKAELYPSVAPNTVNNFIALANDHFYDGLIFHRCIKEFMIQGGDPQGTGMGGPGYSIKGEFNINGFKNDLKHERGVISMARSSDYDSAGSQFFIMVADGTYLDGQYAAFGRVTEGMDVVDEIVSHETDQNDRPVVDQKIKNIRVDTLGVDYPKPEKVK